jgi:hypothetical protein
MKLTPLTSERSEGETKSRSTSKRQSFSDSTVIDRIEIYRNKGSLQFSIELRPAYIAGFNHSLSDTTTAPIPSQFAGGNETTRAYCCGAHDASLCLPICDSKRLFNKSAK